MIKTLTDIVATITVAQLILFSAFLLGPGKPKSRDKIFLALFLASNGIFILNFAAFRFLDIIPPFAINFLYIGASFGFLFGPLLYFYTRAVISKEYTIKPAMLLHIIPFLAASGFILFNFSFRSYSVKLEILNSGLFTQAEYNVYSIFLNVITLVYMVICMTLIRDQNKKLLTWFSAVEKINFHWLKLVIAAFFLMWLTDLSDWFLTFTGMNTKTLKELLTLLSVGINFVFANLLIYKNLRLPESEPLIITVPQKTKYEYSGLAEDEKKAILASLESVMCNEKLYLNADLNLGEVAEKLQVSSRHLSQVINEVRKQNFYDFVNYYRVEEVKRLLASPEYRKETILGISYDCGFNSKSVFNTVFKKYTGSTPSEYRKKVRQADLTPIHPSL